MPMNMLNLEGDAISSNYDGVKDQLEAWIKEGRPDPGPKEWLSGENQASVAAALCQVAAIHGLSGLLSSLAEWSDPTVRAGVVAPCPKDGYTPAHVAAGRGHAHIIKELANTGDAGLASLAKSANGWTPAQLAAHFGHAGVLMELLDTQDAAVLASLFPPDPNDKSTPEALARAKRDEAHKQGDQEREALYAATAGVLTEVRAIQAACDDLDMQPTGSAGERLLHALRCPVSLQPFTTRGLGRPFHLKNLEGDSIPQQCVSEKTARTLVARKLPNPHTKAPIGGAVYAQDRATLVGEVRDAYIAHADVRLARVAALAAFENHERKVVAACEAGARALAQRGEAADWRAILAKDVAAPRGRLGQSAVASAAGGRAAAAAGARDGPGHL